MLEDRNGGPYVIAEVGQNHNGSVGIATELIRMAADPRPQAEAHYEGLHPFKASAVKFTKRKLSQELTAEAAQATYEGPNSFGHTYGAHRRALELKWEQMAVLAEYAKRAGVDFGMTVCHPHLVARALEACLDIRFLKVASRDITNQPLLDALAKVAPEIPKVVSLGMATEQDLLRVLNTFDDQLGTLTIMHCRSIYPTPPEHWDLQMVPVLRQRLEPHGVQVGYSCHALGMTACVAAVAMGAQVVEKHVTLDRRMQGGDHLGSVDRGGLWRLLRDVNAVDRGQQGTMDVRVPPVTQPFVNKLGRSLAWATTLMPDTEVEDRHLCLVSPGTGLPWSERHQLLGKRTTAQVEQLALCTPGDVA